MHALRAIAALFAASLASCALVTANDGNTVTLEHDFIVSDDSVMRTAAASCAQAGKRDATLVAKVSKNPSFAVGSGVVISTFRCT